MSLELSLDDVPWKKPIFSTKDYYVFFDGYPVNIGHMLFVPKFNTQKHIEICLAAAYEEGRLLVEQTDIPAFNVGMNCGAEAGQTVMWPHVHMIPRVKGDMDDPRGGVRHVIPERGNYKKGVWTYDEKVEKYDFEKSSE